MATGRNKVLRLLSAFADLTALAVRAPSQFLQTVHPIASSILDSGFETQANIPTLQTHLLDNLRKYDVCLPRLDLIGFGTQTIEGLVWLLLLAKALDVRSVFEIGTFTGVTSLALTMNLPRVQVHTLDLPPKTSPSLEIGKADSDYLPMVQRSRAWEGRPESSRITQHLGDSARFDFAPFRSAFQLVYVDGAHSRDYIRNDTNVAFKLVSEGGVVVWDDYHRFAPDVPLYLNRRSDLRLARMPKCRLVVWLSPEAERDLKMARRLDAKPNSERVPTRFLSEKSWLA